MTIKFRQLRKRVFSAGLTFSLLMITTQMTLASPPAQTTPPPVSPGNPENGRALFLEEVKLANHGPACISCHSIDDLGILGGGVVGPDLTQAADKYGQTGILAALADIQFPTMQPLFANHPLTASEQADLAAYIISVAGQPQSDKTIWVIGLGLAGFLAAMAAGAFIWRGRLRYVRVALVEQSRSKKSNP